jgi:uncharacterized membrane protein YphA (DoxX/SURF4 family)
MTVYTLFLYVGIVAIVLTALLGYGHSKVKRHQVMHPLAWLVQYFLGSLLIFSGLVKGVDPLGTAYKMQDYFTEFDTQGFPFMDVMHEYALPFSVFMLVLELVLGACLILGLGQKKTSWTTLLMMLFFTALTGFNYLTGYTNKVDAVGFLEFAKWEAFSDENIRITDCGCFGDFMKLTPLETFIKDIIYVVLSLFLLAKTRQIKELFPRETNVGPLNLRTIIVLVLIGISSWFCLKNFYLDIPMVDFRPFAEGIDLRQAKIDCDNDPPVAETYYVLKNASTNETMEINSTDYVKPENKYLWTPDPATGKMTWEIQSDQTKNVIVHEGCNSQIQYFNKTEVFDQKGYQFLVLAKDLDKTDKEAFKQIGANASIAEKEGIPTRAMYNYISKQSIDAFRQEVNGAYEFSTADEKLIKTIIRSNPGLVLIKDGVVVKKWHHKHIPDYATIQSNYMK